MSERIVGDLSRLPAAGFRTHGLWFWAAMAFMLMEGVAFALAAATYLYLMNGAGRWPLADRAPDLGWGTAQTVLLLASLAPTWVMCRSARLRQLQPTRVWAVVVFVLNTLALVIRGFEFAHLNTHVGVGFVLISGDDADDIKRPVSRAMGDGQECVTARLVAAFGLAGLQSQVTDRLAPLHILIGRPLLESAQGLCLYGGARRCGGEEANGEKRGRESGGTHETGIPSFGGGVP